MNRKGFTLIELLGCLLLMAVILGIGLFKARGTLATSLSTLVDISENGIYGASKTYVLENGVKWINVDGEEYTCLTVNELVDKGYFESSEVNSYKNDYIKIFRNPETKVIKSIDLVDECE